MRVVPVPCLSDNYAYLVAADGSDACFVVDASEAEPVLRALDAHGLRLAAILATHHHHDHVGGIAGLLEALGPLPVYAHASDEGRVPSQSVCAEHGAPFVVAGLHVVPLHVPGHTRGAVAYVVGDAVFTGDTLFVAGCGRLFEGTAAEMHRSLNGILASLPLSTKVYCGHEYTARNLRFAASVDPGNEAVAAKLARVAELRARGEPTVPSTIGEELATNPFLRVDAPAVRARFPEADEPAAVFASVRAAKDAFR